MARNVTIENIDDELVQRITTHAAAAGVDFCTALGEVIAAGLDIVAPATAAQAAAGKVI